MKMKNILTFLITVTCINFSTAQIKIRENEKLVYTASYNMSGLMTNIVQVTFQTKPVKTEEKTYLNLSMEATTYSKWDSYFKIRDVYESYVNPTNLVQSLYKRNVHEGDYTKTEKYVFKSDRKTVNCTSKRKSDPEKKSTFYVGTSSMDIVTALYKMRTYDYPNKQVGSLTPITIIFDEKEVKATIKYLGKETIKAGPLGEKECYKIAISSKSDALKGDNKNIIWITADSKRIPASFQFSIPVGTGKLILTQAN